MIIQNTNHYIICHDQNIINSSQIPYNHKWLFVGNRETDRLENNVIICNTLKHNIEKYPYLCSFTAWYAMAKNNIAKSNNITLIEYDSILKSDLSINNIKNNEIICYNITLFNHYVFYKSTPWLAISLKEIYDIDLQQFIDTHKHQYKFWPTTTNITLSKQILDEFVDWFLPMTEMFKHDPFGAYVHERAFFVFCILNKVSIRYLPNILEHKQLASHGVSDFYGSFLRSKNSHQLCDHMIKEYDELYDNLDRRCKKEN
jgi:hypothetical protein